MLRNWLKDVDGNTILLFVGVVWFTMVLVFVEYRFQQDAQIFQVVAGLVTGFSGAFLGLMKAKIDGKTPPNPPSDQPPPA